MRDEDDPLRRIANNFSFGPVPELKFVAPFEQSRRALALSTAPALP